MSRAAAAAEPLARVGDRITVSGRVKKLYGPGKRDGERPSIAVVETFGGEVHIPLTVDGLMPDPSVVVTPAPPPMHVHQVQAPGHCPGCSCGSTS